MVLCISIRMRDGPQMQLALKHFVGHNDEVEIFYSDNAPELMSAMKVLQWRHVLSRDYVSKSNAQAERAVKSVLEGTRHWHWPHAARHSCLMENVVATGGKTSSWASRFGAKFDGPMIPFWLSCGLLERTTQEKQRQFQIRSYVKPRHFPWLRNSP